MYHIYSQDYLPSTGSVTVLTDVCTISTHKTIYHPLAMVTVLTDVCTTSTHKTFTIHWLATVLTDVCTTSTHKTFTIYWLCYCPYGRMYHIYSQDIYHPLALLLSLRTYVPYLLTRHLPSTRSATVLTDVCTTSTHKTIYHPLALLLSLRDVCTISTHKTIYHLLAQNTVLTRRMYHIYSQDYLPSTGSVTVLTDVCTTSTHKTIYHLLAL